MRSTQCSRRPRVSAVWFGSVRRVRTAMTEVPRHEFVPLEYRSSAYRNTPLPIGHGQTISQPLVVGLMTELLQLTKTDRVLEIVGQCPGLR